MPSEPLMETTARKLSGQRTIPNVSVVDGINVSVKLEGAILLQISCQTTAQMI
jgi:hypothetical protein